MKSLPKIIGFVCPCCGYDGLAYPPYKNIGSPPYPKNVKPPYHEYFGEPSYDVCACCGFEFGLDDDYPVTEAQKCSFENYLKEWIANGCNWFEPDKKPENWNLIEQLKRIDVKL